MATGIGDVEFSRKLINAHQAGELVLFGGARPGVRLRKVEDHRDAERSADRWSVAPGH
jgi:hypothetical protein